MYDENTGRELDYWWDSDNGGEPEADKDASDHTGTLSGLCPGQHIIFEWNETGPDGQKDGGPEFIVYDSNEEELIKLYMDLKKELYNNSNDEEIKEKIELINEIRNRKELLNIENEKEVMIR